METKMDFGQICNSEDIIQYLEECIQIDGLSPEDLIYWMDDVEYAVKTANKEFQEKYGY